MAEHELEMEETTIESGPERYAVPPQGAIPNSGLPLLVWRGVAEGGDRASAFERLFEENGWGNTWRNGIYDFHHFHSDAHEVLGIAAGEVTVRFGGDDGPRVALSAGDAVTIPAGVSHRNEGASGGLLVIGGYAGRRSPDLRRGDPGELREVRANIAAVPTPGSDPVEGVAGVLPQLWAPVPAAPPGAA